MASKSHTTPSDAVVDNGDGTYSCTAYFVMASISNGIPMGIWQMKINIGNEAAYFYPTVGMPSAGTITLAKLTGVNDSITGIAGPEKRTYFLFSENLAVGTAGTYNFGIFLATKETLTSFPAVRVGSQLKDQTGTAWPVTAIAVQLSTDGTTWVNATDSGNGHWSVTGLTGLTAGTSGKIYAKVTVNGEHKTTDGAAAATTNGYQTFTVIP